MNIEHMDHAIMVSAILMMSLFIMTVTIIY